MIRQLRDHNALYRAQVKRWGLDWSRHAGMDRRLPRGRTRGRSVFWGRNWDQSQSELSCVLQPLYLLMWKLSDYLYVTIWHTWLSLCLSLSEPSVIFSHVWCHWKRTWANFIRRWIITQQQWGTHSDLQGNVWPEYFTGNMLLHPNQLISLHYRNIKFSQFRLEGCIGDFLA